ncbi:transaldolase [Aquabacter cavernae]|uniref:transaldolase n=1 Tax=Aquabacter cavernae TaxID=2496029 RepID=UPI000F8CDBED|nr:transaldolase [Aquabacter cavernae]
MASKLDQLRQMTVVVADTGDMEAVARFRPIDCTTNPTIVLKALDTPAFAPAMEEAVAWGRAQAGDRAAVAGAVADRLAISVGYELSRLVPGRVSTEVDASLSFNTAASVAKAREIIAAYAARGVGRERILIKLASTWEGIRAAEILQAEGIDCNMTLLFNRAQAVACADAKAFLISPFVGRILDWHKKAAGRDFTAEEDPGVRSVREIYGYYKSRGIATIVMAASFRNTGEIEALAGCDRLTIAPALLDALSKDEGALERVLSPETAPSTALIGPADLVAHGLVGETAERFDVTRPLDEPLFRWVMNEDPMATEKLAEGIRLFARDLSALHETVLRRLEG